MSLPSALIQREALSASFTPEQLWRVQGPGLPGNYRLHVCSRVMTQFFLATTSWLRNALFLSVTGVLLPQSDREFAGRRDKNSLVYCLVVFAPNPALPINILLSCLNSVFIIGSYCDNPPRHARLAAAIISFFFPLHDCSLTVSTGVTSTRAVSRFPLKVEDRMGGYLQFPDR
jgi:hypothetical protein